MDSARKGALLTAAVTSVACMADTILYSVLPIYAESIGLSDFWIGLCLSINRFVRIFSHGIIASFILRFGLKRIVLLSSIFSALCSFLYQIPHYIILFAATRMVWGIAYSGFRQAILVYAAHIEKRRNETIALAHFIKSIGPFLILIFGPYIFENIGFVRSYYLLSLFTLPVVALSFFIPKVSLSVEHYDFLRVLRFSYFKILLFIISFITDGLIIVILFILLQDEGSTQSSLLVSVSFYLLLKRFVSLVLSLLFLQSYKFISVRYHFYIGVLLIVFGLVLLQRELIDVSLVILFIGSACIETAAPIEGVDQNVNNSKLEVMASITLWWDIGKAFGAFLGIIIYKNIGHDYTWIILTTLLMLSFLLYHNTRMK